MAIQSFLTTVADTTGSSTAIELVNPITDYFLLGFDSAQLTGDVYITYATTPVLGQTYTIYISSGGLDLNGFVLNIFGLSIPQEKLNTFTILKLNLQYLQPTVVGGFPIVYTWYDDNIGAVTPDGSILFSKLEALASGKTIVGNGSNVAVADYIKNANIDASAGIARTKIASGTASRVVVNDGAGALAELAQLSPALGGTGIDSSSSTGVVSISSGTWSVGARTESITFPVSFEAGEQCNNRFKVPAACTITGIYAVCTKAIAATDSATITFKNAAGTSMTSGTITFNASDPLETAYSVTPSANNTASVSDILYAVTAKTTSGGKALVTITYTRNT